MPRTTIDLDASVLRQLRRLQSYDRRPLSELVNQLLARALAETELGPERWITQWNEVFAELRQ